MWRHNTFITLCILAPLACAFAFALDIYIPSIPKLPHYFHTSSLNVQLTLSLFLLVNGLGQLFVGPYSDQIGRRKIAIGSILLYIVGSAWCAASNNIGTLITARIVQALGASGCMIVAFATVRDIYHGNESAKMFTYVNSAVSISPMCAPVLGTLLDLKYGWRASFVFLIFLGLLALLLTYKGLSETLPQSRRRAVSTRVFSDYWKILSNTQFLVFAIGATTAVTCFFTYFSASAYVYMVLLHATEIHFALFFALTAAISLFGGAIGGWLCENYGTAPSLWFGSFNMLLGSSIMVGTYFMLGMNLEFFLLSMCFISTGATAVLGACASTALAPFQQMAGTAAAMLSVFYFTTASAIGALLLHHNLHSYLPLAALLLVMSIIACIIGLFAKRDWIKP